MQNSKLSRLALLRFPALQEVCCFHFVFSLAKGNANVASYWSLQLFCFFVLFYYCALLQCVWNAATNCLMESRKIRRNTELEKWTIGDIQVEKLGEYRCNANNKYGGNLIFNSYSLQVVFVRNHVYIYICI